MSRSWSRAGTKFVFEENELAWRRGSVLRDEQRQIVRLGPADEAYHGLDGNDIIYGNGDDQLYGDKGSDRLYGGSGDDILYGGVGQDRLNGGPGDDTLTGQGGSNLYYGGLGADSLDAGGDAGVEQRFRYLEVEESTPVSQDRIGGFATGIDTLDIKAIDANALTPEDDKFSWIGGHALSGVAGELRYDPVAFRLQGDVNGDGVADFQIQFESREVVTRGDIVL